MPRSQRRRDRAFSPSLDRRRAVETPTRSQRHQPERGRAPRVRPCRLDRPSPKLRRETALRRAPSALITAEQYQGWRGNSGQTCAFQRRSPLRRLLRKRPTGAAIEIRNVTPEPLSSNPDAPSPPLPTRSSLLGTAAGRRSWCCPRHPDLSSSPSAFSGDRAPIQSRAEYWGLSALHHAVQLHRLAGLGPALGAGEYVRGPCP
jgi:hypothetical protein